MSEGPTLEDPRRGNRLLKLLGWVVVGVIILVVLFTTVFPWLERTLSTPTLGG